MHPLIMENSKKLINFASLDLAFGFHHIEINRKIRKVVFTIENGHFEFDRKPIEKVPAT